VSPVRTSPGPIAFTRIRRDPSSIAATWASIATAAFVRVCFPRETSRYLRLASGARLAGAW
jgi:hypothetical protein